MNDWGIIACISFFGGWFCHLLYSEFMDGRRD